MIISGLHQKTIDTNIAMLLVWKILSNRIKHFGEREEKVLKINQTK